MNESRKIISHVKKKIVDKEIMGPKHKVPERTAIFDPQTEELLTDKMKY